MNTQPNAFTHQLGENTWISALRASITSLSNLPLMRRGPKHSSPAETIYSATDLDFMSPEEALQVRCNKLEGIYDETYAKLFEDVTGHELPEVSMHINEVTGQRSFSATVGGVTVLTNAEGEAINWDKHTKSFHPKMKLHSQCTINTVHTIKPIKHNIIKEG